MGERQKTEAGKRERLKRAVHEVNMGLDGHHFKSSLSADALALDR